MLGYAESYYGYAETYYGYPHAETYCGYTFTDAYPEFPVAAYFTAEQCTAKNDSTPATKPNRNAKNVTTKDTKVGGETKSASNKRAKRASAGASLRGPKPQATTDNTKKATAKTRATKTRKVANKVDVTDGGTVCSCQLSHVMDPWYVTTPPS